MSFAAIFSIIAGVLVIFQWRENLNRRAIQDPNKGYKVRWGTYELILRSAAEFATALMLILAGTGLLSEQSWGESIYLLATGMFIYSAVNSPGYFVQQKNWAVVAVYAIALELAILGVILFL